MTQGESGDKALIGGEIRWTGFGNVQALIWTVLDWFVTVLLQIWIAFGQALEIAVVRTDDGLTIKKVQIDHHRQQIILQPFNIDYPVLVLDSDWNYGAFLIGTIALQLRFF